MNKALPKFSGNIILLVFFIALYCYTNSFYVNWGGGDSPCWVLSVMKTGIPDFYRLPVHQRDFFLRSNTYPLFITLGKYFNHILPGSNTAYKVNTMVAIFGGLAVFMVFLIIKKITSDRLSAMAGSLALLFSHHFWLESNLGEVYTLHFFIVSAVIYNLVKWADSHKDKYLYFMSVLIGLGITHHRLIFLIIPPVFLFCLFELRNFPKNIRVFALCLFALMVPSLVLNSTSGFLNSGGSGFFVNFCNIFKETFFSGTSSVIRNFNVKEFAKYFAYLFYQFPVLGFTLGLFGIFNISKKVSLNVFFISYYLLCVLFPSVYTTTSLFEIDRPTFYIGSYVLFSIFIGSGFYALCRSKIFDHRQQLFKRFSIISLIFITILPIAAYLTAPGIVKKFNIYIGPKNDLKYRDFEWYFLFPPKRWDDGTHRFGMEALKIAEPNAYIYANFTPQYLLIYSQFLDKGRWDVNVYNRDFPLYGSEIMNHFLQQIRSYAYEFPVYVVAYTKPKDLKFEEFLLEPAGPLHRIIPASEGEYNKPFLNAGARGNPPDFKEDEMVLIPEVQLEPEVFIHTSESYDLYAKAIRKGLTEPFLKFLGRPFLIDKYEVSAKQFADFLNACENKDEQFMGEDKFSNVVKINGKYCPRNNSRFLPANNVTAYGAMRYAAWKDKRLPNEIEWERASTNNYSSKYPWGDCDVTPQLANYHKNWTDNGFRVYAPVYEFPLGDNKWGVRQLMGNVMEWVQKIDFELKISKRYDMQGKKKIDERGLIHDGYILKGGSWYTYPRNIDPLRFVDIPPYIAHNVYGGFRCVKDIDKYREGPQDYI